MCPPKQTRRDQIKPRRSCLAQLGSADLINKIKKFQGESKVLWRRFPRMTPVNSLEINQLRWVTQSHASLPQTPKPFSRGQFAFSLFSPCYFLIRRGMQLAISMSNLLEDSFSLWPPLAIVFSQWILQFAIICNWNGRKKINALKVGAR